ncbi:MAG TPA: hemerythrin domain-containing protein [Polyangiales bacterium]
MTNPLEEIASRAMGAAKGVKATFEGLTGVFRQLAEEHGEVSALLLRVKNSEDPDVRAELFPKIRKELLSHEKGELTIVYPAFQLHPETKMIADKHAQEASQLEKMIETLTTTSVRDSSWPTKFDALVDLVQRHVTEEESKFFPAGERVLHAQTDALRTQYIATKTEVMKQLG